PGWSNATVTGLREHRWPWPSMSSASSVGTSSTRSSGATSSAWSTAAGTCAPGARSSSGCCRCWGPIPPTRFASGGRWGAGRGRAQDGVPYVVTDCGEADEGPVERLSDRLASGPLPDPALAVAILRVLATGIDHAHDEGVVHGDLAPSAVIFGVGGVPKLTDLA